MHQPPTSNLLYESVSAWVYAWQTTPLRPPCPEPPADIRAAFDKLPPLGALEDWHFLVIPVQPAYPWVAIEPATDTCFHREPAKFTIVEQ